MASSEGTFLCAPHSTVFRVIDPAPPHVTKPSSSDAKPPKPVPDAQVLQECLLEYQLFVFECGETCLRFELSLPMAKEKEHATLEIVALPDANAADVVTYEVRLSSGPQVVQTSDGGPSFKVFPMAKLIAMPALPTDVGTFEYSKEQSLRVTRNANKFSVGGIKDGTYTMLELAICLKRRFLKNHWNHFNCKREPEPKSALLKTADRTGDIILVGGEGVEVPAHSAILVDVPYFEARLREEWSGETAWNINKKLRLNLPCSAGKQALQVFLKYVYGDTGSIFKVKPWSIYLQEVLLVADACRVPPLCADICSLVMVTSANVDSWLEWLLKEHGVDASPIRQQVVQVMKDKFQNGLRWDQLSMDQLSSIANLQRSLTSNDDEANGSS